MTKNKILQAMWNELYKQEDDYEKKFIADPNLDVSDWYLYRHWFQLGHAIGIKVVDEQMKNQQEIVRCKDCIRYPDCCRLPRNDPNWFCADGKFAIVENPEVK